MKARLFSKISAYILGAGLIAGYLVGYTLSTQAQVNPNGYAQAYPSNVKINAYLDTTEVNKIALAVIKALTPTPKVP